MAKLKRTYTLMGVVLAMFLVSLVITMAVGIPFNVALIDNALDSLQIGYNLIPLSMASNPWILISKLLDAGIFPVLTVILAAWFFGFIQSVSLREQIVLSKIKRMEGHVIIAPYNQFAKSLIQELKDTGIKIVVIADSKHELAHLHKDKILAIEGDMRKMETFEVVNISKARYLIACSKDDVENALITITAKTANPRIKIIARANAEESMKSLLTAGAKKVVIPERAAGHDLGEELVKRVSMRRDTKNEVKGEE